LENMTTASTWPVEQVIRTSLPVIAAILVIAVIRFFLSKVLSSLVQRGSITLGTKSAIMRFVDLAAIVAVIITVIHAVTVAYEALIAVVLLIAVGAMLFFYELKEFAAFVNLQLLRPLRGRTFEILLPHHEKPVYGRIVAVDLLNSLIEDTSGRKIYVANSLLSNAVFREHYPYIALRITLKSHGKGVEQVVNEAIKCLTNVSTGMFRIEEREIEIEKISVDEIVLRAPIHPTAAHIRSSNIARLVEELVKELKDHDPVIEVLS